MSSPKSDSPFNTSGILDLLNEVPGNDLKSATASLILVEDFESGKMTLPRSGNYPVITQNPVRAGEYAMKSYLHCTESATNYRTEVYVDDFATITDDYWYGFSIYLPSDYISDRTWEIVAQWHGWPDGYPTFLPGEEYWRNPILALRTTGGNWSIGNYWDSKENTGDINNRTYDGNKLWELGAYEKEKWVDWVFHIKWSYESDGILEVWKDGELVISRVGPNCYNDEIGPYFKMGIYKGWENWWNYPSTEWWHHDVADERTLYHDELRIAHGQDGYDLVSPSGPVVVEKPTITRSVTDTTFIGEKILFSDSEAGISDTLLAEGVHTFNYTNNGNDVILTVTIIGKIRSLTIKEVQGETTASPWLNSVFKVNGTVTHVVNGTGFFIQDANAAWSGIWVLTNSTTGITAGSGVEVTGTVVEDALYFEKVTTLKPSDVKIVASKLEVKAVVVNSPVDAENEKYEAVLITVKNVTANAVDVTNGSWLVYTTENNDIIVNDWLYSYNPVKGNYYNVTGIINGQNNVYKIEPRKVEDITALESPQSINTTEDISICEGEEYFSWTEPGQYVRTLVAQSGVDSIVTTNLTVNPSYNIIENITIFEGEDYFGYTESGEFDRVLSTSLGCDSTVTTVLTVLQSIHQTEDISICEGENYLGWTETGKYEQVFTAQSGADSVITTNLTVNPNYNVSENITIFEGEEYFGQTETGEIQRVLTSISGCDSTVTTQLTVLQMIHKTEDISICEGENYLGWEETGEYERTLESQSGADSIVTTRLWVNPVYTTTENVTISEGENYYGWTESGEYHRVLTSSTGCDSTIITFLTVDNNFDYFETVWENENGQNHMNFYIVDAYVEDLKLQVNDEVAVFDGDLCVGTAKLATSIDPNDNKTYLQIVASQNDGTGNGFTDGNPVSFKIWDYSEQREIIVTDVVYKDDLPSWITDGEFASGGTAIAEIKYIEQIPVFTQQIKLYKGWNIFSSYVVPEDTDMGIIQETLRENESLVKVQDETGNTYEKWNANIGWVNNIGNLEEPEGYKIRVKNDCVLEITGQAVVLPANIELKTGWNLISFPVNGSLNALEVVQPLINNGTLDKVQDERGNSIEYWGESIGWINGIGNFNAGEGYKILVNQYCILPINETNEKSALANNTATETQYFDVAFIGNGSDHMNINMVQLNDLEMQIGDEIAAFDGDICVGATKVTEYNLHNNAISISTSVTDEDLANGFSEGNDITLKFWNMATNEESVILPEVLEGNLVYNKQASVFIALNKNTPEILNEEFNSVNIDVYPNPASNYVTVRFSSKPVDDTKIILSDITGKQVLIQEVNTTNQVVDIQDQPAGIYFVKTVIGNYSTVKKLIINNN